MYIYIYIFLYVRDKALNLYHCSNISNLFYSYALWLRLKYLFLLY